MVLSVKDIVADHLDRVLSCASARRHGRGRQTTLVLAMSGVAAQLEHHEGQPLASLGVRRVLLRALANSGVWIVFPAWNGSLSPRPARGDE
jgi:hypothetical protein